MIFLAEDELTYAEIREQTKMNDEDLTRSLHSLSCAKYKLLLKTPVNNRINKADQFKLNLDFQDKARRIKVFGTLSFGSLKFLEAVVKINAWISYKAMAVTWG